MLPPVLPLQAAVKRDSILPLASALRTVETNIPVRTLSDFMCLSEGRPFVRCLLFVFLLLGSHTSHHTAHAAQTTNPLTLRLDELYSEKFAFSSGGTPTVNVGVMDGQAGVTFSCPKGGRAQLYRADGSIRRVRLRANRKYRIEVTQQIAAVVRYAVVVGSFPHTQLGAWKRAATLWKKRGFRVSAQITGSAFAVKGRLFDTRKRLLIVSTANTKSSAMRIVKKLTNRYAVPIRVHEELIKRPSARFELRGNGGRWLAQSLVSVRSKRGLLRVYRVEFGKGYRWHTFRTRLYHGRILFAPDRYGTISVVNRVSLPKFLRGLLRAEMPASAPLEALKAQAVCARNEILAKIGTRHRADPYLFCAHTHCQVYTGSHKRRSRIRDAIRQTRGMVMVTRSGRISDAPFSALCGGHTEHNENVWQGNKSPALRGKADVTALRSQYASGIDQRNIASWIRQPPMSYCQSGSKTARRRFRWTKLLPASEITQMVNKAYAIGPVRDIKVRKRGVSGRAYLIQITGNKTVSVNGELRIRRLFGGLNSSMFLVSQVKKPDGTLVGWRFEGGGWGHGVGMCQYGAIARAKAGFSFRSILKHYYSNIQIQSLY